MPPRKPARRQSRASLGKASELMGPPPAPVTAIQPAASSSGGEAKGPEDPLASKILGQEVKALRECLIDAATTMAQLVNHHTDIHKIGVERHAPYPPRGLREAWIRQSERYDDVIDSIEIQLQRALAAVEYQIEQESERLRIKESEELARKGAPQSAKGRKPSMSINIPKFSETSIDPLTVHPDINISSKSPDALDTIMQDGARLSEEPMSAIDGLLGVPSGAAVPKDGGISRNSRSSISLTSLNRHGLKLDLSSLTLDGLSDNKSSIAGPRVSALGAAALSVIEGMASPVTLAPKSARPRPEFDPELDLFLNSAMDSIQLPPGDGTGATLDVAAGDINMDDLFGDNEMGFSASGDGSNPMGVNPNSTAMDSLFSPDDMLPVKTEEMPISLTGGGPSQEDKLLEELGFVEISGNPMASTSTAAQPGLSLDNVMDSFDSLSNDFNLMQQQLQQRQQFGLDLNLPAGTSGETGQHDADNSLSGFNFDLFGTGTGSAEELNFDIFDQPSTTDGKTS